MRRLIADLHNYQDDQMLIDSFLKYRLFLNGKQFGADPFRPIIDTTPVLHEFDISDLMREGKNVFGVISRGNLKGFALLLKIKLKGGKVLFLFSDSKWKYLDGNPVFNHFAIDEVKCYGKGKNGPGEWQEHIIGEKYPTGWLSPEYDDSDWLPAETRGKYHGQLEKWNGPNYELKSFSPVKIKKISEGHFFIDFGHELIAGIELDAPAKAGSVEILLGEELTPEKRVRYEMRTVNHYRNVWTFSPNNDCLANFSLHAFRYAEVIGWDGELSLENIRAITVGIPFNDNDSTFSCSNT